MFRVSVLFARGQSVFRFSGIILLDLFLCSSIGSAQSSTSSAQSPARPTILSQDSVNVPAYLSAEEMEEDKLNQLYQEVAKQKRDQGCTSEVMRRYQSEVIPVAETSRLDSAKNKFLFLANRDLGNCYLDQKEFTEAEKTFQTILEYALIWPGTEDSAYPINFRHIATAQIGQQHWTDAEQSLLKSITLFDAQIAAWEKEDPEFSITYRGSESRSYTLLAVVYFRENRIADALSTVERAYEATTKYKLDSIYANEVVSIGRTIANASGDPAAQQLWAKRQFFQ